MSVNLKIYDESFPSSLTNQKLPEVFIIKKDPSGKIVNKNYRKYVINRNAKKHEYELDSVIIRDTKKRHFCCLVTCNKEDMGFDGDSFGKLVKMSWKNKINSDKNFSFEQQELVWNFSNGYQYLFY